MTIKWEGICSPVSVYYDKLGARWQSGSRIVGQGARGSNPPAAFRNMANLVQITLRLSEDTLIYVARFHLLSTGRKNPTQRNTKKLSWSQCASLSRWFRSLNSLLPPSLAVISCIGRRISSSIKQLHTQNTKCTHGPCIYYELTEYTLLSSNKTAELIAQRYYAGHFRYTRYTSSRQNGTKPSCICRLSLSCLRNGVDRVKITMS